MNPRPIHGEASCMGSGLIAGGKALITYRNSGIGRAVAIAFSREGADVVINSLPAEEDAQEVVALIRVENGKVVTISGDIREETFCKLWVSQAATALGELDILASNTGRHQFCESVTNLCTKDFGATSKTNLYGLFIINKGSLGNLLFSASIINTSSVQAFKPSDILMDYTQTKAAIVAFTKSLAKELVQTGIRINAVAHILDGPAVIWRATTGKN
jgi:NAD(P)-dependent dehydrogenase (short-subunit alcohol dehydrogenase family)